MLKIATNIKKGESKMKAVNMKNYKFEKEATTSIYMGYGILDEETNTFVSLDGVHPYVLCKKSTAQTCINGALDLETCERVPVPVQ